MGPCPSGRDDKGRQGHAGENKPGKGDREGPDGSGIVREGFSEEVMSEKRPE